MLHKEIFRLPPEGREDATRIHDRLERSTHLPMKCTLAGVGNLLLCLTAGAIMMNVAPNNGLMGIFLYVIFTGVGILLALIVGGVLYAVIIQHKAREQLKQLWQNYEEPLEQLAGQSAGPSPEPKPVLVPAVGPLAPGVLGGAMRRECTSCGRVKLIILPCTICQRPTCWRCLRQGYGICPTDYAQLPANVRAEWDALSLAQRRFNRGAWAFLIFGVAPFLVYFLAVTYVPAFPVSVESMVTAGLLCSFVILNFTIVATQAVVKNSSRWVTLLRQYLSPLPK